MDTTVVFAADVPAVTISDRVRRVSWSGWPRASIRAMLRPIPPPLWVASGTPIVGRMFPRAVITDRSVITGGPVEGVLYLAYDGRGRETELPSLTVLARAGAGPLDGDIALPGGLYQSGCPNACHQVGIKASQRVITRQALA
jgi:hypothetical protein